MSIQAAEVVVAPLTLWLATPGTAFPAVDAAPSGSWFQVGSLGTRSYDASGVTVNNPQTIAAFTPAGSTAPRKPYRTDENVEFTVSLADMTVEQYAKAMDDAAITTTPQATGVAGNKAFELLRGFKVKTFALLARGVSSYDDSLGCQFEVPACYQSGTPGPVFSKNGPALLAIAFTGLERTVGSIAVLREQTTVAG